MDIPNTVIKIGDGAFWGCESLEKVNIPDSVEEIGRQVFGDCDSLSKVIVPKNVELKWNTFPKECEIIRQD